MCPKPVHPKGNQPWIFIGRTDAEAETPILWAPDAKNWVIWKDPDAGKDWGQEEKGTIEDETVGWHHQLDGHEFEQAPGVGNGQGGLACCGPWGRRESDLTERLDWTWSFSLCLARFSPKAESVWTLTPTDHAHHRGLSQRMHRRGHVPRTLKPGQEVKQLNVTEWREWRELGSQCRQGPFVQGYQQRHPGGLSLQQWNPWGLILLQLLIAKVS